MRKALKRINEQRRLFRGIFERFGTKSNWHGFSVRTVLLRKVRDKNGKRVADHLWFNYTKGFQALGILVEGDVIEFYARVREYTKGYVNYREMIDEREIDYKLSYPTKFRKVVGLEEEKQ